MGTIIKNISFLNVWNALGNPSLQVLLEFASGQKSSSIVQQGISTGSREKNPSHIVGDPSGSKQLLNTALDSYEEFDIALDNLNYPPNIKSAFSLAFAKGLASEEGCELWQYLLDSPSKKENYFPKPLICVFSGGLHNDNVLDFQDVMLVPEGFKSCEDAFQSTADVFKRVKRLLKETNSWKGYAIKGAYSGHFENLENALDILLKAISLEGFNVGSDFTIGLDVAATTLWNGEEYILKHRGGSLSPSEFISYMVELTHKYPISFIEDPLYEDSIDDLKQLKRSLSKMCKIICDDICSSNMQYLRQSQLNGICDKVIIKPSQAGSLSRVKSLCEYARKNSITPILAGRSGDNELSDMMDIAWGMGFNYIKVGGFFGSETLTKYNRCIYISSQNNSQ